MEILVRLIFITVIAAVFFVPYIVGRIDKKMDEDNKKVMEVEDSLDGNEWYD